MNRTHRLALEIIEESIKSEKIINVLQENFDPDDIFEADKLREYIGENYGPEDVFDPAVLEEWWEEDHDPWDLIDSSDIMSYVIENFTPDELYGSEYLLEFFQETYESDMVTSIREQIKDESTPEDIFEVEELEEWARNHGFIMPDDCPEPTPSPEPGHIE